MVANKPADKVVLDDVEVIIPPDLRAVGQGSGRSRAFEFGVIAASYGQDIDKDNPYSEGRGSGSFRKSWRRGFEAYHAAAERVATKAAS